MSQSSGTKAFEMPLHLQLAMRKAELEAHEMTWDQLVVALLNLYHQRLMELQAIKDLICEENIDIEFDIPSELDLARLAVTIAEESDDDDLQSV